MLIICSSKSHCRTQMCQFPDNDSLTDQDAWYFQAPSQVLSVLLDRMRRRRSKLRSTCWKNTPTIATSPPTMVPSSRRTHLAWMTSSGSVFTSSRRKESGLFSVWLFLYVVQYGVREQMAKCSDVNYILIIIIKEQTFIFIFSSVSVV